jgi:hypothetical protein
MKKVTILYWVFTCIFSAFMVLTAIPDILLSKGAIDVFARLGYPTYLLPFLGTAKILGVIVVLSPGFRKLKEWAYAGIAIDLVGAFYSHLSVGDPSSVWGFSVIGMALLAGSYLLYGKKFARLPSGSRNRQDEARSGRTGSEINATA